MDNEEFLQSVRQYVAKNPLVAPRVTEYVAAGLSAALQENQERAADMEALFLAAICRPKNAVWQNGLFLSKLERWRGKTSVNFAAFEKFLGEKPQKDS